MCLVSAVGQSWTQTVPQTYPWIFQPTPPSVDEIAALRREVEELRTLLLAAKRFDEATGQPDCETEDKVALIRRVAEMVGVDLDDVLSPHRDTVPEVGV